MKNSVLSLFKKKQQNNHDSDGDSSNVSPSSSHNSLNNQSSSSNLGSGSPHSGSFSNIGDILQNGSLVYNSLPESGLSYGHIQTPFNVFELNRRMYQTNSQLLQKQNNSPTSTTTTTTGTNSPQQQQPVTTLTPSLLMGKRKDLNRISTQSPTSSSSDNITPRSSSPSITNVAAISTTTTTTTSSNGTTNSNADNVVGSIVTTPSTPIVNGDVVNTPTIATTATTTTQVVQPSTIVKTALSDQDKLISHIACFLVPHKDHLKSRELLAAQHFSSVLLLNKKWNSIVLANDLSTINDDIVKSWAILVEEMYEPAATIENDHMSRKFIELCMYLLFHSFIETFMANNKLLGLF